MPVASYDPALLELFRAASRQTYTIQLETNRQAIHLRARLHNLRAEMRKEDHYLLPLAEKVQFSVEGPALLARPADTKFLDALTEAGIDPAAAQLDTTLPATKDEPLEIKATKTVLADFMNEEHEP